MKLDGVYKCGTYLTSNQSNLAKAASNPRRNWDSHLINTPRVSTPSMTSICLAVFAQRSRVKQRGRQTDRPDALIIDCNSPYLMHSMRPYKLAVITKWVNSVRAAITVGRDVCIVLTLRCGTLCCCCWRRRCLVTNDTYSALDNMPCRTVSTSVYSCLADGKQNGRPSITLIVLFARYGCGDDTIVIFAVRYCFEIIAERFR